MRRGTTRRPVGHPKRRNLKRSMVSEMISDEVRSFVEEGGEEKSLGNVQLGG